MATSDYSDDDGDHSSVSDKSSDGDQSLDEKRCGQTSEADNCYITKIQGMVDTVKDKGLSARDGTYQHR